MRKTIFIRFSFFDKDSLFFCGNCHFECPDDNRELETILIDSSLALLAQNDKESLDSFGPES